MNITQIVKKCAMDAFDAAVPCDVVFGKVKETEPLKIQAGQLELEGDIVDVCGHLKYRDTKVIYGLSEKTIVLNEGLKKDDAVVLVRKCGGESYIVIGKIG